MYSLTTGLIPAVFSGVLPFIPGDVIKIYAAYMIAKRLP
jgi:biotin transporter BioY